MLQFTKREVRDPMANNWVALTYLLPDQWTARDQLTWYLEDTTFPVRYAAQMHAPDGRQSFEVFPVYRSNYSHNPGLGTQGYPPPRTVTEGLRWIISQMRPGLAFRVMNEGVLPGGKQEQQAGYDNTTFSLSVTGWVRIEYDYQGQTYEEEFYGSLESLTTQMQSYYSPIIIINWGLYELSACRSVKGQLDQARRMDLTIRNSYRNDPHWYDYFTQVVQMGVKGFYQNLAAQRRTTEMILQHNREISQASQAAFEERMQSQDRINEQFRDTLGGVERYYNPSTRTEVQLPLGYQNAWVNAQGDKYIVSETAGFNPNHSTQLATEGWQEIEKKQYRS